MRKPTVGIDHELAKARRLYVIKHCPAAIGRSPLENGVLAAKEAVDLRPNEGAPRGNDRACIGFGEHRVGFSYSGLVSNVLSD